MAWRSNASISHSSRCCAGSTTFAWRAVAVDSGSYAWLGFVSNTYSTQLLTVLLSDWLLPCCCLLLLQLINEKPQTIQEYESGKAIPNPQILSKLSRVLGVTLRKNPK
eukprot:GHUV01057310.1.p1 GENE.GHUV01057310.1~~GHUV01057310.1.p1  ORF type:complete len:108 (-),score=15.90 GHUV01057310.1:139-462(-)